MTQEEYETNQQKLKDTYGDRLSKLQAIKAAGELTPDAEIVNDLNDLDEIIATVEGVS